MAVPNIGDFLCDLLRQTAVNLLGNYPFIFQAGVLCPLPARVRSASAGAASIDGYTRDIGPIAHRKRDESAHFGFEDGQHFVVCPLIQVDS